MISKKLSLVTLIFASLVTTPLFAQERVLYCVDELSVGFYKGKDGWKATTFEVERFKVRVIMIGDEFAELKIGPYDFKCNHDRADSVVCKHKSSTMPTVFLLDAGNLRYAYTTPSKLGYTSDLSEPDTDSMSIGQCEEF